MSSNLLDALSATENDPSGGYKANIISKSPPSRGRRKPRTDLIETISETVEIIDDSSNSSNSSSSPRFSPVKSSPKLRRKRVKQTPLTSDPVQIPGSVIRPLTSSPSTSETSEASPPPSRGIGAPPPRGKGPPGPRTGAGRGAARTGALQAKKLRGTACGANLIGIQHERGCGKIQEDLAPNPEVCKLGRRWAYAKPIGTGINSTPKENSVAAKPRGPQHLGNHLGANGMSRLPLMSSSDCDSLSTDLSTAEVNVSTSEKDGSDSSFIFEAPVRSRRQIKKPERYRTDDEPISAGAVSPMRSPTRKLKAYDNSKAEKCKANKKLKSFHQTPTTAENQGGQKSSDLLRRELTRESKPPQPPKNSKQQADTRNDVHQLSAESKQSLAALEPNLKGVTSMYALSSVMRTESGPSKTVTEVTEADSTIEVPSDDDAKGSRVEDPAGIGDADTSTDGINFISDAPEGGHEERVCGPTGAVCPHCGALSTSLQVCKRCRTDFKKRRPKTFRSRPPGEGEKVCSKCGAVFRITPLPSGPTPKSRKNTSGGLFICKACQQGGIEESRENNRKDTSSGPGAALKPKSFYSQKMQAYSSANTVIAATTKPAAASTKRPALSSRARALPNKRNKGRTKPEPECISLIDSDEEDTPEAAMATGVIPQTGASTPAKGNTRKAKMKNEAGEPVGSNANSPLVAGSAVTPQASPNTNNSHPSPAVDHSALSTSSEQTLPMPSSLDWDKESLSLTVRLALLAFGSRRFVDLPLTASISPAMIKFHFTRQDHGCCPIPLPASNIVEFQYHLQPRLPFFFIKTIPAFALKVRSWMNMQKLGDHFDPHSREVHETMLLFRPYGPSYTRETANCLSQIIDKMKHESSLSDNFRSINAPEVNRLLALYTPPAMIQQIKSELSSKSPRVTSPPPKPKLPAPVLSNTPAKVEATPPPAVTIPQPVVAIPQRVVTTPPTAMAVIATVTVMPPSTTSATLLARLQPVQWMQCVNSPGVQRIIVQSSPAGNTSIILPQQLATHGQPIVATQTTPTVVQVTTATPAASTTSSADSTTTHRVRSPIPDPSQKVLTYPPPPTMGGITVTAGDMGCLEEGEFLNDVIIEFYLRYLLEERLSSRDRQRTHIFSSFFYKRLTQQDRGSRSCDQIKELTAQEKRHQRVRKWTRRVDLFEKDFIIIPINESSHWYVAFICFPSRVRDAMSDGVLNQTDGSNQSEGSQSGDELLGVRCTDSPGRGGRNDAADSAEQNHTAENGSEATPADSKPVTSEGISPAPSTEGTAGKALNGSQSPGKGSIHGSESAINRGGQDATTTPTNGGYVDDAEYTLHHSISNEAPCIIIMDSLKSTSKRHVIKKLREYLEIEWRTRKNAIRRFTTGNMKGLEPAVPQQSNYSDCGIYILQYVEQFFKKPIKNFSGPLKGLSNWFPEAEVKSKREAITQLVLDLKAKQEARTNNT